jgi:hypothetical protein
MEIQRKGNWGILRYGNSKQGFTYWVVSYPYRETTLQFKTLKEARNYFDLVTRF